MRSSILVHAEAYLSRRNRVLRSPARAPLSRSDGRHVVSCVSIKCPICCAVTPGIHLRCLCYTVMPITLGPCQNGNGCTNSVSVSPDSCTVPRIPNCVVGYATHLHYRHARSTDGADNARKSPQRKARHIIGLCGGATIRHNTFHISAPLFKHDGVPLHDMGNERLIRDL